MFALRLRILFVRYSYAGLQFGISQGRLFSSVTCYPRVLPATRAKFMTPPPLPRPPYYPFLIGERAQIAIAQIPSESVIYAQNQVFWVFSGAKMRKVRFPGQLRDSWQKHSEHIGKKITQLPTQLIMKS